MLDGDVTALADFSASFAGVVIPGETLRVDVWDTGDRLVGTATVVERDAPALANVVVVKS